LTEQELLREALQEKLFSAEKRISALRLVLILFNSIIYLLFMGNDGYSTLGLAIVVAASIYSILILTFELYRKFAVLRNVYFTTVVDSTLIFLWIIATGFMESPFYVVWYISIIGVAYRYSLTITIWTTVIYLLLYMLVFYIDPGGSTSISIEQLLVRMGYIPLAGMLGMYISLEISDQIDDKIKIVRKDAELRAAHNQLEQKVEERTEQLSVINKDLVDSMNYAKRIQLAILPSNESLKTAFPESFVINLARDVISGDFYWIHQTEEARYFAVVDCTGHGVPGALMSMIANNLLNKMVIENGVSDPGKALKKMDLALAKLVKSKQSSDAVNDGMDMILGVINSKNELSYAGAYGLGVMISDGKLQELNTTKSSIGGLITSDEKFFETHTTQLKKGDSLYFYSDGFQDQFGGVRGKKFLRKNLFKLLLEQSQLTPTEQQYNIVHKFHQWKGDEQQTDDVTVLGFKV
jgi:serine phosphatase RsbU (regulator of sigma subunit)